MKIIKPHVSLLDQKFAYVDSAHTDIRARFDLIRREQKAKQQREQAEREAQSQPLAEIFAARRREKQA